MFKFGFKKEDKLDYLATCWIDEQLNSLNRRAHKLTYDEIENVHDFLMGSVQGECLNYFLNGVKARPKLYKVLTPLLLEVNYKKYTYCKDDSGLAEELERLSKVNTVDIPEFMKLNVSKINVTNISTGEAFTVCADMFKKKLEKELKKNNKSSIKKEEKKERFIEKVIKFLIGG